jgi:hypothetical protein
MEAEHVIRQNRHVSVMEQAAPLDVCHGSVHHTVCDIMQFLSVHKVGG